ncbi:alanyl-tRNA synthetase [Natronincola peptidivorans]|uniref:Alanine--tRNA ligase n=1 Tax=Natronincola peptidivorans TaxID=426128 RepID=A0A1I0EAS4_9FIRM|nr:DHHA1 domain-containing protein [Natronincola peptidivorans]SET42155.1 alanyl-tRNA synthetase [Natronincola peptidivorans]
MKTDKLFWQDPYLKAFTTNIVSIEVYEMDPSKSLVVLKETAFYPEGGGQPWDEGTIGEANVHYVYEEEDIIYHVVDAVPSQRENVVCKVNWERRFDIMQQHLGQHILSSVFEKLYDATTVGFHLGKEYVTIDIDKPTLENVEVEAIERKANEIIYQNIEVKTLFPTKEEVKQLPLRKASTVTEGIRIVEIDSYDFSPCGGTHPSRTGAVGIIKIRKWEKNKGNTRVEFLCGKRASEDFYWKNQQVNDIASLLSVKDREVFEAVSRINQENRELTKSIRSFKKAVMDYQVKELYMEAKQIKDYSLIIKMFEGEDFKDIKFIASSLSQYPNTICLLATKTDKAQVVFSCSKDVPVNMNQLFKEVISLIDGKGGGNATSAQGGGSDINNLEGLLQAAEKKVMMEYI